MFNGFKHLVIPILGVAANFLVLLFYLVGPFSIAGMSWHESYIAFGVALVWAIWGAIYLNLGSKKTGKTLILTEKPAAA
jgi:basic amino acid/polyamine antiporter, APA family